MAWNYLKELIEEVGPRRAGTEGEDKAREWILRKCKESGLKTEIHNFSFIKTDYYGVLRNYAFFIILYALLLLSRDIPPAFIFFAIALYIFFESRIYRKVELRLAKAESANIMASFDEQPSAIIVNQKKPVVLIAAHYDTARTMSKALQNFFKINRFLFPFTFLAFVIFLGIVVIRAAVFGLVWINIFSLESLAWLETLWKSTLWASFVVVCAPYVILNLAVTTYSFATRKSRPDSIGADDNASGVAATLAIMKNLQKEPLGKLELVAAFWGVEEKGLFGSRQFLKSFGNKIDKNRLSVINLDGLGVGDTFSVLKGQGIIFRKKTDPSLVNSLRDACDEKGAQWKYYWETLITGSSGDHAEWLEKGFKAITVIRENYKPPTLPARVAARLLFIPYQTQFEAGHIHTIGDTLNIIETEKLEKTVEIVQEMITRIKQQL